MNPPLKVFAPAMQPQVIATPIRLQVFAFAFLAAAMFALTSRYPGYVHHDTAEIVMWSRADWSLGLPKHPPLLPYLFNAVSYLIPLNWVTLSLLTAGNIVLGAWAVWRIGLLMVGPSRATVALLIYGLAPAGTFFALKFNHNAILVSLWPLTILAFLSCLRAQTGRASVLTGVAFGALAAGSMLAKYYSGVLVACCFVAALASTERWRFFTSPGGYVAVAVFAVLVAPHAWWMWESRAATLNYALHEADRDTFPLRRFLMVAPTYALPSLAGYWVLRRTLAKTHAARLNASMPTGDNRELWVLAVGPFALTLVLIAAFKLRGAASWTLPDFCVLPVLLAALLPQIDEAGLTRLKRIGAAMLGIVAALGPVVLLATFVLKDMNTVEPRFEMAGPAARIFKAGTDRDVTVVAGDPQSVNAASLDMASRPTAVANFNFGFSPWVALDTVGRDGLLAICRASYPGCRLMAEQFAIGRSGFVCEVAMQRRLLWLSGPTLVADVMVFVPNGTNLDGAAARAACLAGGVGARFVRLL